MTPIEQEKSPEGKRYALHQLATHGLLLTGTAYVAPVLLGSTVPMMKVATVGSIITGVPFLGIGAIAACGLLVWDVTRRVPRVVTIKRPDVKAWRVCIGRTARGVRVYHDFAGIPHMKAGGATGSGKTKGIELILAQLVMTKTPEALELHIIDMKGGASFAHFANLPHVQGRIYADAESARDALYTIHHTMNTRLQEIRAKRGRFERLPKFPRILVVIDEGGELSPAYAHSKEDEKTRRECLGHLSSLARVGREPCISLLYSTQRPSNETLPVSIRGQMDATLAFRTQNELDSAILLRNENAAAIRNIKGRMIYQTPDGEIEVQGGYIPDKILETWLKSKLDTPTVNTLEVSYGGPPILSMPVLSDVVEG